MDKLKEDFAAVNSSESNPYMQCLANLLDPPTKLYMKNLTEYYESILPTLSGKKKEVVEKMLATFKKKQIK